MNTSVLLSARLEALVEQVRPLVNEVCLIHFTLARLIGVREDRSDCYLVGLEMNGTRIDLSVIGECTPMRPVLSQDRYEDLDAVFTLNGAPPVEEMLIESDTPKIKVESLPERVAGGKHG